jgi:hypothetical protein
VGEAQLREHACHPGLASAKQSQRSAQNPVSVHLKDERHGGQIKEAVRLTCCVAHDSWGHVELKRTDGSTTVLRIVWRTLPRRGGGRCCWNAPTAESRAVTSTVGNGTAFRDGRTELGVAVGDVDLVLDCVTHPRAAICAEAGVVHWPRYFALSETCLARSPGFPTCSPHLKRRRKPALHLFGERVAYSSLRPPC